MMQSLEQVNQLSEELLLCQECGKQIFDPMIKDQRFCVGGYCAARQNHRNFIRRKNNTNPTNYRGRYKV